MAKQILLDAGPLGMISHPRPNPAIAIWTRGIIEAGIQVVIPEIADFEVRRELLRARRSKGVERLNELKTVLGYTPITTSAMLIAAEYWAFARNHGFPTADDVALDADVILAAQAKVLAEQVGKDVVVISTNVGHLSHFTDARKWNDTSEKDFI